MAQLLSSSISAARISRPYLTFKEFVGFVESFVYLVVKIDVFLHLSSLLASHSSNSLELVCGNEAGRSSSVFCLAASHVCGELAKVSGALVKDVRVRANLGDVLKGHPGESKKTVLLVVNVLTSDEHGGLLERIRKNQFIKLYFENSRRKINDQNSKDLKIFFK